MLENAKKNERRFTVSSDYSGLNFFLKSNIWPGFINYYRANSAEFGHLYFGNGLKMMDFDFI